MIDQTIKTPQTAGTLWRFFDTAQERVDPETRRGVAGTAVYGGYIVSGEKDPRLTGTNRYTTYSNILANISIVAASVRFFLDMVAKPSWVWEPADKSDEAKRLAEFFNKVMGGLTTPWHRIVKRAAMFRFYGYSLQEWIAAVKDGAYVFEDIEARPQSTVEKWSTDIHGRVFGVTQRSPQDGKEVFLPRPKCIYVIDDATSDSPEGVGISRHIVRAATRLERYEQLEGWGYETDLRGIPVGRAPIAELNRLVQEKILQASDRERILAPIEDFVKNHIRNPSLGIVLDSMTYQAQDDAQTPSSQQMWDMELMRSGGSSQPDIHTAIARLNAEIARMLGTDHLILGGDGKGSLALSKDKSDNFYAIVGATLTDVAAQIRMDFGRPLVDLNGWNRDLIPIPKVERVELHDISEVTTALRDMAQAGAILDARDPVIERVRDLLGVPRPPEINESDMTLMNDVPGDPGRVTEPTGTQAQAEQ